MFGVQVFDRESPLTNRRCRDVQFLFPPLRARVSRWTGGRTGLRHRRRQLASARECFIRRHAPGVGGATVSRRSANTESPSVSFRLPGAEGWVLSAPPIGSPGFRVSRQDVPGFNVGTQDDAPGLNLDENGLEQQETNWSDGILPGSVTPQDLNVRQTPTPPTGEEAPIPPAPPQLPEWLYKLVTMLPPRLSTAFDPRTERPIAINSPPGLGSAAAPGADQWPPSSAPQQPADIDVRSRTATTQDTNPQPAAQEAMRTAWLQPLKGRWPYAQGDGALPSIPSVRPPADSDFSLANADDADEQQAQQQTPSQQYQPSAPLGSGLPMVRPPERPSTKTTGLERGAEQEFSQLIEAYQRLEEAEGKQPGSARPSPPPPLNENGGSSYASGNDGPSLGRRTRAKQH